jgi:transcriptional regulator GlxA family with amidase domain
MKKIVFIIPPTVQLLDLAGPVQVFAEAKTYGYEISIEFYTYSQNLISGTGLPFGELQHFKNAALTEGDLVFIPGMDFDYIQSHSLKAEREFFNWIGNLPEKKIVVSSICNGAFLLGEAGLLNNINCTTHWNRTKQLQDRFPSAKVVEDVLFVKSGQVYTSAGISAGVDLALSILEDLQGPLFTYKIAKELVVYQRRSSDHSQISIYMDYRNHINPQVHKVQDFLINKLGQEITLTQLSDLVCMSPRNLTRVFKSKTGITIWDFLNKIRIENAKILANDPLNTAKSIAGQCGFKNVRQLQRLLAKDTV